MGLGPETGRSRDPEGSPLHHLPGGADSEALVAGEGCVCVCVGVGGLVKDKWTVDVYSQPWR